MAKGFSIKRTGDWNKLRRLSAMFPKEVEQINKQSLQRIGLKAEEKAVRHLRDQDLNWAPLNQEYLQRKIRAGGSEKTLIDTSTYLQSITSIRLNKTAYVGVFRGRATYKDSGEDVVNIAAVHEFGSSKRNIPARPLWKPTMEEMNQWLRDSQFLVMEVKRYFSKNYGI